jgi:hypothetical protein
MSTGKRLTAERGWVVAALKVAVIVVVMLVWHAFFVFALIVMSLVGLRALMPRSETVSVLLGVPVDERWQSISTRAWALAGQVIFVGLLTTLVAMQVWETQGWGGDSTPYALLCAALATAYLGAVLWYRWRQ